MLDDAIEICGEQMKVAMGSQTEFRNPNGSMGNIYGNSPDRTSTVLGH